MLANQRLSQAGLAIASSQKSVEPGFKTLLDQTVGQDIIHDGASGQVGDNTFHQQKMNMQSPEPIGKDGDPKVEFAPQNIPTGGDVLRKSTQYFSANKSAAAAYDNENKSMLVSLLEQQVRNLEDEKE